MLLKSKSPIQTLQTPVELIRLQPFQWTEFLTSGISTQTFAQHRYFVLDLLNENVITKQMGRALYWLLALRCNHFLSRTKKNPPFGGSVQKLYIALSSASISRDRFLSPSRYCGVKTSVLDICSSFNTTDWRELFSSVSILWTLFRSRVKSSIAIVAFLSKGGLWSGLRSWSHTARPDFFFRGDCETWQAKSELPKNYASCPINRPKPLVIGQSQHS